VSSKVEIMCLFKIIIEIYLLVDFAKLFKKEKESMVENNLFIQIFLFYKGRRSIGLGLTMLNIRLLILV
jgi:hypothetical protein